MLSLVRTVLNWIVGSVVVVVIMTGMLIVGIDNAFPCDNLGGCVVITYDTSGKQHSLLLGDPKYDAKHDSWIIPDESNGHTYKFKVGDVEVYGPDGRYVVYKGHVSQICDPTIEVVDKATGDVVDYVEDAELIGSGSNATWVVKTHASTGAELRSEYDAKKYQVIYK